MYAFLWAAFQERTHTDTDTHADVTHRVTHKETVVITRPPALRKQVKPIPHTNMHFSNLYCLLQKVVGNTLYLVTGVSKNEI